MNKEEAKVNIHNAFAVYATGAQSAPDFAAKLYEIVDAVELEHQKVLLPETVGDWVDWVKSVRMPGGLFDKGITPLSVDVWLKRNSTAMDESREKDLMRAYLDGWTSEPKHDKLYRVYVPETGQVYVYTHRVWSDRKVHLEVQELEEQSDDSTELFTMKQIQDLNLEDYDWEEVRDNG